MEPLNFAGAVAIGMLVVLLLTSLRREPPKVPTHMDTYQRVDALRQLGDQARREIEEVTALYRRETLDMLARKLDKEKSNDTPNR